MAHSFVAISRLSGVVASQSAKARMPASDMTLSLEKVGPEILGREYTPGNPAELRKLYALQNRVLSGYPSDRTRTLH